MSLFQNQIQILAKSFVAKRMETLRYFENNPAVERLSAYVDHAARFFGKRTKNVLPFPA
jgi:hypothetical protein